MLINTSNLLKVTDRVFSFMFLALSGRAINRSHGNEDPRRTCCTDREDRVSKIFYISPVCLTGFRTEPLQISEACRNYLKAI